jgi:hypothetical protein
MHRENSLALNLLVTKIFSQEKSREEIVFQTLRLEIMTKKSLPNEFMQKFYGKS